MLRWSSTLRRSGALALLGALCLSVSCEQRAKETEPAPVVDNKNNNKRMPESDLVGLDDKGPAPRGAAAEQTLVQEPPPPQQVTKPPPVRRPRATVAKIAVMTDTREESEAALEKRHAPHERASSEIVPRPHDKDRPGETPTTSSIYNPRLVLTQLPIEPPPPPPPVRLLPDFSAPPEDRSGWTTSDVMLAVGSLSTVTGAVAVAGDGSPEARILGISMLGLGLVSYGTVGILYLNEHNKTKPVMPATDNPQKTGLTSVSVGTGISLGGHF